MKSALGPPAVDVLERSPDIGAPSTASEAAKSGRLARSDCIPRVRCSSFNTPTALVRNQQLAIDANPKTVGIDLSKNLLQRNPWVAREVSAKRTSVLPRTPKADAFLIVYPRGSSF